MVWACLKNIWSDDSKAGSEYENETKSIKKAP
jgi:hypothetical protein